MKVSEGFIKILVRLQNGDKVKGGDLKSVLKYLEPMLKEGGLKRSQLTKTRFEVFLVNKQSFNLYLKTKFDIEDLDGYLLNLQNPNLTRSKMLTASSDDKARVINPFDGLYISSYDDIDIAIDGKQTKLNNLNGSVLFISSSCRLEVDQEVLIVGVENTENLLFISKQIEYFTDIKQKKVFIYKNHFMLDWLEKIENSYLHYGDFDFAGISIYKSQILPRVKSDKRFFIPSNIEEMLKRGKSDLYYKHYSYKKNLMGIDDSLDELINLIEDYKKTVRQEFLIEYKG